MGISSQVPFDSYGRLIPDFGERVFGGQSQRYYQIASKSRRLSDQVKSYKEVGWIRSLKQEDFLADRLTTLLSEIESSPLQGLLRGSKFPYFLPSNEGLHQDIGGVANNILFPKLKSVFEGKHKPLHFRASLQGRVELESELAPLRDGGYDRLQGFLAENRGLIGWVFPECLAEYSLSAQLKAYARVNNNEGSFYVSLGGIHDVSSALIATPDMLINYDTYPPVLCLGGIVHSDPRYFFSFKSHGNHLEFWGMPRALTIGGPEQVSEQWTGVISIFSQIDF